MVLFLECLITHSYLVLLYILNAGLNIFNILNIFIKCDRFHFLAVTAHYESSSSLVTTSLILDTSTACHLSALRAFQVNIIQFIHVEHSLG